MLDEKTDILIDSWKDIVKNILEFQKIIESKDSHCFKHFADFKHWYYLPNEGIFGPSKFIGYKGITIHHYNPNENKQEARHGQKTEMKLKKYFLKLDKKSSLFERYYDELEQFAKSIWKKRDRILSQNKPSGKKRFRWYSHTK